MQMQSKNNYAFAWICFTGGKPITINDSNQIEFRLSLQFSYCDFTANCYWIFQQRKLLIILLLVKYQPKQQHNISTPIHIWTLSWLLTSSRHATDALNAPFHTQCSLNAPFHTQCVTQCSVTDVTQCSVLNPKRRFGLFWVFLPVLRGEPIIQIPLTNPVFRVKPN